MAPLPPFMVEIWIETAIAVPVVVTRLALRTKLRGFRGWQWDDWFALIGWLAYSFMAPAFHVYVKYGGNDGLTKAVADTLTEAQVKRHILGAGLDFGTWYCWVIVLWSSKAAVLALYARITMGLWQQKLVRMTCWATGLTFVVAIFLLTFGCGVDVSLHWEIRNPPGQCVSNKILLYFAGPFNLVTDLACFIILLPVVAGVNLKWHKKLAIYLVVFSGAFVMVTSTMRTVYSILAIEGIGTHTSHVFRIGWAVREVWVSVMIVNLPIVFSSAHQVYKARHPAPPPHSYIRSDDSSGQRFNKFKRRTDEEYAFDTMGTTLCTVREHGEPISAIEAAPEGGIEIFKNVSLTVEDSQATSDDTDALVSPAGRVYIKAV